MKEYPSIKRSTGQSFQEFKAHVFDKLDGSNIRAEWNPKRGWYKFGSRTQLLSPDHPVLGSAIPLFLDTMSEDLSRLATDMRWKNLIVFAEFYGPNSFAGTHDPADVKTLTLFDICPDKRGIAGPSQFLKLCGDFPFIPRYFGEYNWTRPFVHSVFTGEANLPVTFEGVVGKAGEGHKLIMAKAKTQQWIDKVFNCFGPERGKMIVES